MSVTHPTKRTLSPLRQRLVELMQRLNYGRLEHLQIRSGEPVFDPPPTVIRERKFEAPGGPRPELQATDFLLKERQLDLFRELDQIQNGVIDLLEIKHGLPFRLLMQESAL